MYNDILHVYGHYPEDKTEERIAFSLSHARLYLSESDDEKDDKSAVAKTFDIFCGGGVSISSLSVINVSVFFYSRCSWLLNIHVISVSTI